MCGLTMDSSNLSSMCVRGLTVPGAAMGTNTQGMWGGWACG